ncbi:hypothetical protein HDU76_001823 [Blyttiomyces sp. JEL0837]|nr:hypothetical protein HDU76_001823 [Blyttiomyces sp. JEL0837]
MAFVHRHDNNRLGPFQCTLNFYETPPKDDITLSQFEEFALDRLRVLKAIENAQIRNKNNDEMGRIIKAATDKYLPLTLNSHRAAVGVDKLIAERKKDHISHFILRLAYCRSEDNRAWFLRLETMLFHYRLTTETSNDKRDFLDRHNLNLPELTTEEKYKNLSDLRILHGPEADKKQYYKVPFEKVLSLVSRRSVLLRQGFAFVPDSEQSTLITQKFNEHLAMALDVTAKAIPRMDEDDRLLPILNAIANQMAMSRSFGMDHGNSSGGTILANEIDKLALEGHFPLCMSNLQYHLKADHHLKHQGRLQFGLFLKGIGVPVEEALVYWRKSFSQITDDKFSKEYAYNIRYNYGLEGARKNYSPYSCQKIIMGTQPGGAGEHHGCPFKCSGGDSLKAMISRAGAPQVYVHEIANLAREGHFQIACTRLFEVARAPALKEARKAAAAATGAEKERGRGGGEMEGGSSSPVEGDVGLLFTPDGALIDAIEHPNQWFELSYRGKGRRRAQAQQPQQQKDEFDEFDELDR